MSKDDSFVESFAARSLASCLARVKTVCDFVLIMLEKNRPGFLCHFDLLSDKCDKRMIDRIPQVSSQEVGIEIEKCFIYKHPPRSQITK